MTQLVRAVRQRQGLTLDELALATGLTKSYLSKVERGQSTPSIAAAMKVARALDVDVAQLFSDDPTVTTLTIERATDRTATKHHPIASGMLGKAMSPFVVRPGRQFGTHVHFEHPGQEFLFVHAGTIELKYGDDVTALETGDCAYFDASQPHKLRQVGETPAEAIVVTYDEPRRRGE
ncbi:helix-turn-helix domain-containing protein [Mycolicibacterium helvum]|uniref:Putative transcription regulator protein n=1 Tax=Mycolicibacterium helvum TaxID=1534349 RepID=A0A7I7T7V2_9MYCO|nr:XRE family transcriptional regulator [Mycolicibacterium helvum]BBY64206.1 putative transcription regulator protein [Mycolicibacterium helvum]